MHVGFEWDLNNFYVVYCAHILPIMYMNMHIYDAQTTSQTFVWFIKNFTFVITIGYLMFMLYENELQQPYLWWIDKKTIYLFAPSIMYFIYHMNMQSTSKYIMQEINIEWIIKWEIVSLVWEMIRLKRFFVKEILTMPEWINWNINCDGDKLG